MPRTGRQAVVRGLALAVMLALGAAVPATADTFCVPGTDASCSGTPVATIGAALTAAKNNGSGRDTIRIAAQGTPYQEDGLVDDSGNPVDIVGAGPTQTVIQPATNGNVTTLDIEEPSSTVSNLGVRLADANTPLGLELAGASATGVAVTSPGDVYNGWGVSLDTPGSRFAGGTVSLPTGEQGVGVLGAFSTTLEDSTVTAATGVAAVATVRRDRITAPIGVTTDLSAVPVVVEDSLITVPAGSAGGPALQANASGSVSGAETATLTARHDTLVGNDAHAIGAECSALDGPVGPASCSLNVDSTLFPLQGTAIKRQASACNGFSTSANVAVDYSSFDPAKIVDSNTCDTANDGGALTRGAHNVTLASPGFLGGAAGSPNAYNLTTTSPAIDAGRPDLAPGESATDLAGAPRLVAGFVGHTSTDIGAFEYQPHPPNVVVHLSTGVIPYYDPVQIIGTASDPDPGDRVTMYSWSLDGGPPITGTPQSVGMFSHTFPVGTHTVALTATDSTGHSATQTAQVDSYSPSQTPNPGPLRIHLGADHARVAAGARDAFTLSVSDAWNVAVPIPELSVKLPAGWSYVRGSTTLGGARVSDPDVDGRTRVWDSPLRRLVVVRRRRCRGSGAHRRCRVTTALRPGAKVPITLAPGSPVRLRFVAVAPHRPGSYRETATVGPVGLQTSATVRVTAPPRRPARHRGRR